MVGMACRYGSYEISEIFIRVVLNVEGCHMVEGVVGGGSVQARGLPVPAFQSNLNNYTG